MSQSSSPFTVDPQTLLHLKAALVGFRLRTPACPECGGDVEGKPKHDEEMRLPLQNLQKSLANPGHGQLEESHRIAE